MLPASPPSPSGPPAKASTRTSSGSTSPLWRRVWRSTFAQQHPCAENRPEVRSGLFAVLPLTGRRILVDTRQLSGSRVFVHPVGGLEVALSSSAIALVPDEIADDCKADP